MTTTTAQLEGLIVTALIGTTGAGANVFGPRDWPVTIGDMPIILVQPGSEHKESLGRNAPQFTVTATIPVEARVTSVAGSGDAGAAAVLAALQTLQRQIEVAVINNYGITILLQQFPFVETELKVSSEAKQHVGTLSMRIGLEFYQGPEDFAPTGTTALAEMAVYTDLVNVFDPTGTYPNPPFPGSVEPAPRTQGPDGRTEGGGIFVNLPQ